MKTIKDFLNNRDFKFPSVPTGEIETVKEFYEKCIKIPSQQNVDVIKKWHNLLVNYAFDANSIKLSRLYESRKKDGIWDTRRGMQTVMADNFSFAFASNFFARIIYSMVYAGFVPMYDDFKNMFINHEFSLYSFRGKTDCEKRYSAFKNKSYRPCFYTQGWYLAHIISVNDMNFHGFPAANINEILSPGSISDWRLYDNLFLRKLDKSFTDDEKRIVNAHFLRFIDPINYFLVPNRNNVNYASIGENKKIIKFMIKKHHELYQKDFEDFLELALVDKNIIPQESLDILGDEKLDKVIFSSDGILKKTIRNHTQSENKVEKPKINDSLNTSAFLQELHKYRCGNIDKSFSEQELVYSNNFIEAIAFSHSNKWTDTNQTEMEKMWSIIYRPLKDFSILRGWTKLLEFGDIEITKISKGQHTGNFAIRIRRMKKSPNREIINKILDYIFLYNEP